MAHPSPIVKPSLEEIMPIYQELFPRHKIQALVKAAKVKLYWRVLTPLVVLWGFIIQRLQPDHSCDAVVCHLHSGAADDLDPADPHAEPLSQRLKSESTSAYVQGRNRLPLSLLQTMLHEVSRLMRRWLPAQGLWKGHAVRLLDGATYRLLPKGDLLKNYGLANNQHGSSEWVLVRSVAAFCLYTQSVVAYTEGPTSISEKAMVKTLMQADDVSDSLYLGDQGFGVYRTAQTARACHKKVILRVESKVAQALQKRNSAQRYLKPGEERHLEWTPLPHNKVDPDLSPAPIAGRLIYAQITQAGFRPIDLYLFTTLRDDQLYLASEIVTLYGQRLRVEIDYRHLKTTLQMEEFDVQSTALFRKELAAGLLTYNLICAFMVKAALIADLPPSQLSFSRCWRRIRDFLLKGIPAWVYATQSVQTYLLQRLAKCKLAQQPNKVRYEPRKVRRRPAIYPHLKGDRKAARQEVLNQFLVDPIS
jgi:hypothetical protein